MQSVNGRTAAPGMSKHPLYRQRAREWAMLGFFVILAALFYGPILLGARAFPDGDFVHHFFPFSLFQYQTLSEGRLPIWNPFTYGGHPFLADVQAAVFYPVSNLIYLFTLPITDVATRFYWLQVEAVVHTALAGWFAYLWTRDLTGSRWGGVVGGTTFALSGYMTGYAPLQLAVLRTAVWLPLLLWCLGRGWQQPRHVRWWLGSIGALSMAFLAGHSQSFMLLGYAAMAWVVCLAWVYRHRRVAGTLGTLLVAVVTIGVTAAQWLPSVEFVRYSVRANVDYAFVSGGLALADLWQLLLPRVLTQYSPLYIGVVGVVLVLFSICALLGQQGATHAQKDQPLVPRRAGVFFCLGMVLFALLASLGGNGPLYPLLYRIAPGWSWFRGQERTAFLAVIGLSGLAAYGMALLPLIATPVRRRAGLVAGAVVVATVYAFGLLWQLPGRTAVDHAGYLLIAGLTLLLGLATVMIISSPGWSARRNAWIVTLAIINLVWANAGTNQLTGTPADRVRVAPEVSAVIDAVAQQSDMVNGLPGRVYNEFRAYDDYGMRSNVEDVWGSSPLRLEHYSALFAEFPLDRMWRLLGVEHVLTWRRELFGPSALLAEFPQVTDTTYLHRLPVANPRAWLVPQVAVADDETTWELLADHKFDLGRRALLGPENNAFAEIRDTSLVRATLALTRLSPESLAVTMQSETDALLVISEIWLPGWKVTHARCRGDACPTVDGAGRAYMMPMRVDLTLVGIWVPAGNNEFVVRYNPPTVDLGLWISGVTLLVLLVSALWLGRRQTRVANL